MPLFCRHNRITSKCSICSKEFDAELRSKAPHRPGTRTVSSGTGRRSSSSTTATRAKRGGGRVVTKRLARAADDGYRNDLVPGLKATKDAERMAAALSWATDRIEAPGPYPMIMEEPDLAQATFLAFLLALAGPDRQELQSAIVEAKPRWQGSELPELPQSMRETVEAYGAWVERVGGPIAAFTGEQAWNPERRFARLFERLALPGFGRSGRFELLVALGASGLYELEADSLHLLDTDEDDATTLSAKRALNSGEKMLLERRSQTLADECGVPLAALDRAFAVWGGSGVDELPGSDSDIPTKILSALGLA